MLPFIFLSLFVLWGCCIYSRMTGKLAGLLLGLESEGSRLLTWLTHSFVFEHVKVFTPRTSHEFYLSV